MSARVAAVGTFDGLHRGHLAVIDAVTKIARERDLEPMAVTFDRHPLQLIAPQRAPKAISTIENKIDMLRQRGLTPLVLPFDEKLRATPALDWIHLLKREYDVVCLVVGYDNTFGSDGVNLSISDYRAMGRQAGIDVVEAPYVEGISSSAVRKAVEQGCVEMAADMLGRDFSLPGIVVDGNKLGRTIGFPTANLLPTPGIVVPARGVYAAFASLPGAPKPLPAMVNIGVRPTIRRGEQRTIEAHVLDWSGDLYGKPMSIAFRSRLRDEQMFKSIDALRTQLRQDAENARKALS